MNGRIKSPTTFYHFRKKVVGDKFGLMTYDNHKVVVSHVLIYISTYAFYKDVEVR